MQSKINGINKLSTGISGFDYISKGGIPQHRATLVSGTSGSAKTIFAAQFLAEGISQFNQNGVFVTFEESVEDIKANMKVFGWPIDEWEKENKWIFVDASPDPELEAVITGEFDLNALLARIKNAIKKCSAERVVIDSIGSIFNQIDNATIIRRELFRISHALKNLKVTSLITGERTDEYGEIARYGVEEFVADNVIILRNILEDEKRRRTIEILKFRGTNHNKGEFPFSILDKGIVIIPLSAITLNQNSSTIRVSSGCKELDDLCSGGFFRDSIILVSGASGTGKTLLSTEFMEGGILNNEKCLLFAFEESHNQLLRNASGWGIDYKKFQDEGNLKIVCNYPEASSLEDHLILIKETVEEFKPDRIAIDSLSALERVGSVSSFKQFAIALTAYIKEQEITGLLSSTTGSLLGAPTITEGHVSTLTDSIILLRYIEFGGEIKRGITVLKMRGSTHDKSIRELIIDEKGMQIGDTFSGITGILSNHPLGVPV